MNTKDDVNQIWQHWSNQAKTHPSSYEASWSDRMAIELEIREILKYLEVNDSVLDVGCATGFSTIQFALQRDIRIVGVDYVPDMIEQANRRLLDLPQHIASSAAFKVGDVTSLPDADGAFDKVVSTRVIINLGTWDRQVKGLRECARVLKPRGTLLLSEATEQGWRNMNAFRAEWGLPEIGMPSFNKYLDEDLVVETMLPELELVRIVNFSSTYYVGTRVLKPLLAGLVNAHVDVANPDSEINKWFAQLPPAGDYGTQKLFVFRKR
ncbi:class I SAM-dependent methyltransferase [Candidatus Bipolaricaulota bacterium]